MCENRVSLNQYIGNNKYEDGNKVWQVIRFNLAR
jgi:hypothetical protein